jgi:phosphoenolpyruvate carboxykinase (ATP)
MPGFNLRVPKKIEGVDSSILMPINTWKDKASYNEHAKKLAAQFVKNFEKYHDGTPQEVIQHGGPQASF